VKRLALLLLPFAAYAAAPVADWSPNVTGTVAWYSNISNGEAVWDRIGTLGLTADALASSRYALAHGDVFHLTVHLEGDYFPRFSTLNRGELGPRLDWQHTFGDDALAPVFTAEVGGDFVGTFESARRGVAGFLNLKLAKKFGEAWRVALNERFDEYDAKRAVFDGQGTTTSLEISRDLGETTRFSLTGTWREGDVVTYAQYTRPDLAAIARDSARLNTFHQTMTAYSTRARTIGGRAALVHAVDDETAVIVAYEYAATRRTDLRFENQTVSIACVRQF
jgi:hypothetical protein